MLNFGHLRQTSPPESCRAQDLPSPLFHPGRQSVWPAAEGSQTLCRGQRPHFLFCFPGHSPPIQRLCAVPAVPGDPPGPPVGGTALKSEAPYVKQSLFDFTITSAKIQIPIQEAASQQLSPTAFWLRICGTVTNGTALLGFFPRKRATT